ncbi:MAG: metallophosphoesterase, partial [Acetobacteraceae bacterium]
MHGDRHGFAAALATERFVIQLGDLTDHGPGSADVLSLMLARLAVGTGLFLLGNHELKLARALAGCRVRLPPASLETVAALDGSLRDQALGAIAVAPAWFRAGCSFFVHGAFHPGMLAGPPPPAPLKGRVPPLLARALYGQTTGRTQPDGYPE